MTSQKLESLKGRSVKGYARLLRKRDRGGIVFFTVRHAEKVTQLLFDRNNTGDFETSKKIPLGSLVFFSGTHGITQTGSEVVFVERFSIISTNSLGLPDKWHGLSDEVRYRNRAVDLMTNTMAFDFAAFVSSSVFGMRCTMARHGYREFNTGVLQEHFDAGLAKPFSTEANFNGKKYYLSLTSELKLKRLILGGFERVFEIAQTFRNEGVNAVCSPEHTLLEAYGVGSTLGNQIALVEELVRNVSHECEAVGLVKFTDKEDVIHILDFESPFRHITFAEACKIHTGHEALHLELEYLIKQYPALFTKGMPRYTWLMKFIETVISPHILQPTFLTHLPTGMSPFVRASETYPGFSERAFFICGGLFIADIYVDENDPAVLIPALRIQAEAGEGAASKDFIKLLQYGFPPTAGFGIGLKRLALLFRKDLPYNIKETILFPL